ncbi:ACT domain-containing protein [Mycena belliarum]|uniref:ACT domain-containing protein n=1 Tax=Mycena belliarum TaxID=1033014 RepID=A0AAD6Y1L1_9AGAR|nr:ACT domain-containing protein [Mycena belliae]
MSPPIDHPCLHLHVLPGAFFVRKLEPKQVGDTLQKLFLSSDDDGESFLSVTRTFEELSVAGRYKDGMPEGYKELASWRAIKIAGPMEFDLAGVLSGVLEPLKRAEVGIFAVSTWNTDYVLVAQENLRTAVETLKADHWVFASE